MELAVGIVLDHFGVKLTKKLMHRASTDARALSEFVRLRDSSQPKQRRKCSRGISVNKGPRRDRLASVLDCRAEGCADLRLAILSRRSGFRVLETQSVKERGETRQARCGRGRMKLSVIVSTRNRAPHIHPCLDSIAAALVKAAPSRAD
jgi:hypothetical protein